MASWMVREATEILMNVNSGPASVIQVSSYHLTGSLCSLLLNLIRSTSHISHLLQAYGVAHVVGSKPLFWAMLSYLTITSVYSIDILGIMSSSLMAIENLNDISLPFYIGTMQPMVVMLCVNGYSNGLNQIFDLEIDKINKPYLPLASGDISYAMAIAITSALALMAYGIAYEVGSKPLFWAMIFNLTLASTYSVDLPFLRWKRSTVATAITLVVARALVILPLAFLHMQTYIFRRCANFPRSMMFGIVMQSFISVVVALFKDLPDIEGDIKFGINSLASRLGPKKVFWICIYLLEMGYAVAVVFGATAASPWSKIITVVSHTVLATALWKRANSIDLSSKDEINSFYMFIWKLMYIEYLLILLVR